MISIISKNIARFFFLILLQVLILNHIQLGGYINPYLYVLFIVLLPFNISNLLLLALAFLLGFSIDIFTSTLGMHTAACVLVAYSRPFILKLFEPRDGYDFGMRPTISDLGMSWFISYAGALVIIHHLALFYIEIFRFSEFFSTFFRAFLSSIFTIILIIISQLLVQKRTKKL